MAVPVPQARLAADDVAAVGLHAGQKLVAIGLRAVKIGQLATQHLLGRIAQQLQDGARGAHDATAPVGPVIGILQVVENAAQFALGFGHGALRFDDRAEIGDETE